MRSVHEGVRSCALTIAAIAAALIDRSFDESVKNRGVLHSLARTVDGPPDV